MSVERPPGERVRRCGEIVVHTLHGARTFEVTYHRHQKAAKDVHAYHRHPLGDERYGSSPVGQYVTDAVVAFDTSRFGQGSVFAISLSILTP